MQHLLLSQYDSVKSSRQVLFGYCRNMGDTDLFKKVEAFNNSCIADLLLHSTNTYIHWLKNFGLDGTAPFYEIENIKSLTDIEDIYEKVNLLVDEFLQKYKDDYQQPLTKKTPVRKIEITLTPLLLFTHVITHEFHHKGQILTMSRLLGYIPVDTDVIRT
ncbi:MAG TPA: DinB family protein [Mucilaginibacter sp.]|nr:DinB family protein [Mucilaginibacter sp.]